MIAHKHTLAKKHKKIIYIRQKEPCLDPMPIATARTHPTEGQNMEHLCQLILKAVTVFRRVDFSIAL